MSSYSWGPSSTSPLSLLESLIDSAIPNVASTFRTVKMAAPVGAYLMDLAFSIAFLRAAGVLTSGIVSGLDWLHVGVCSLQAWLTTLVLYVPFRLWEHRRQIARRKQLLAKLVDLGNVASLAAPSRRGSSDN